MDDGLEGSRAEVQESTTACGASAEVAQAEPSSNVATAAVEETVLAPLEVEPVAATPVESVPAAAVEAEAEAATAPPPDVVDLTAVPPEVVSAADPVTTAVPAVEVAAAHAEAGPSAEVTPEEIGAAEVAPADVTPSWVAYTEVKAPEVAAAPASEPPPPPPPPPESPAAELSRAFTLNIHGGTFEVPLCVPEPRASVAWLKQAFQAEAELRGKDVTVHELSYNGFLVDDLDRICDVVSDHARLCAEGPGIEHPPPPMYLGEDTRSKRKYTRGGHKKLKVGWLVTAPFSLCMYMYLLCRPLTREIE